MDDEFLAAVKRAVLGWPGVETTRIEHGPGGGPVADYRVGRRQIGHIRHGNDGQADLLVPIEVRDALVRSGQATPHPAFPDGRTVASIPLRGPDDVPCGVAAFRADVVRLTAAPRRPPGSGSGDPSLAPARPAGVTGVTGS